MQHACWKSHVEELWFTFFFFFLHLLDMNVYLFHFNFLVYIGVQLIY